VLHFLFQSVLTTNESGRDEPVFNPVGDLDELTVHDVLLEDNEDKRSGKPTTSDESGADSGSEARGIPGSSDGTNESGPDSEASESESSEEDRAAGTRELAGVEKKSDFRADPEEKKANTGVTPPLLDEVVFYSRPVRKDKGKWNIFWRSFWSGEDARNPSTEAACARAYLFERMINLVVECSRSRSAFGC